MPENLEFLIDRVDGSAEWRARKAEQYPDDRRNHRSSAALAALAENLRALPADDADVRAYEAAMARLVDFNDALYEMSEHESHYIGRYGFDFPEDEDPRAFLSALTETCQELVDSAEMEAAEAERQKTYEEARDAAGAEAKTAAAEEARTIAEGAARQAAENAYKEAYDKAYKRAYEEAHKEALLRLLRA